MSPCPKCGDGIPIIAVKHYTCGWVAKGYEKVTAQELYELMCNRHLANGVYNMITVTWDNLPDDQKQTFEDVAAALSPGKLGDDFTLVNLDAVKEAVANKFSAYERDQLYKFLHDSCGCRIY